MGQAIISSEQQVTQLRSSIDEALAEVARVEETLQVYDEVLGSGKQQMDHIHWENSLLHGIISNRSRLMDEILLLTVCAQKLGRLYEQEIKAFFGQAKTSLLGRRKGGLQESPKKCLGNRHQPRWNLARSRESQEEPPDRGNMIKHLWVIWVVLEEEGRATLTFPKLSHNDSGLFFCRVEFGAETARSCGTFVRVHEPVPVPFLALRESTKNRILTAQGILLLLCSAGPGLLLLLRKRWANEQLLHPQKPTCEEENLYEGLNLDECSMYEDISRGVQPTYQDVGTLPGDPQLEKP
ncbi:B-cell antigen receptor complex-associated protein alpha chain [Empidonax traillii]|uniref:B-cell antigen receptor complex-associated protein alpha chain n=1 Tax=Empidonax traillii TaxID=164674 RepID=UPI000FFD1490|nr:B-cell antigen receptor complex-associated protein alpha chain [Empidonax traillii]